MGTGHWRHCSCLDMDIEIERIRYVSVNYVVVNVAYLNRNWQNGNFLIMREKNVKIYKKDWTNWSRVC
jgi:hypothetical protein